MYTKRFRGTYVLDAFLLVALSAAPTDANAQNEGKVSARPCP